MGLTVKKRILINNSYENENIELLTINECLNYINLHVNEKYLNFNENILSYLNILLWEPPLSQLVLDKLVIAKV